MERSKYIDAAMKGAVYEILEDDGSWYGSIPGFQGVWSNAETLTECEKELREVLEGWLELGEKRGHEIPDIPED